MKNWKKIFYLLALIPWTFIISTLAFYFHAGIILGYLPSYNNPDPKELYIYETYINIINVALGLTFFSFCLFVILTIIFYVLNRKQNNIEWNPIRLGLLGYFLALYILFSWIHEWIID